METTYRMAAEWEPQWGIQLTWPHAATDWEPMLAEIDATYVEMAREIARRERLLVATPEAGRVGKLLQGALGDELMAQVTFVGCATDDTWARDHGFLTLVPADGQGGNRLLDFAFNGWGEKFPAAHDNAINGHLREAGVPVGTYEAHLDFVLEGGSIESDGRGTLFTTSQCLLAPRRNQPLTQADIERQLCQRLHARRVVWLDHGQLQGDDTDGHIDTIVRVAPHDTLVYVACRDEADGHYADFQALERQLQALRTLDGHRYRLLPLPMPHAIHDEDGSRLPATYANYLVLNGALLVPTYGQPAGDDLALRQLAQAYPDRELVPIDSRPIIRQHGSIHCCTMQYYE